jgi:hypothetical protein
MNDDLTMKSEVCWSLTHGVKPVWAEPGHYVCHACVDEEAKILRAHQQLQEVEKAIGLYVEDSQLQRQHPSHAKVLENVISDFFIGDLTDLKTGNAFRVNLFGKTESELDVIVDVDCPDWLGGSRRHVLSHPPLAHMEVAFRARFDVEKIRNDLKKVHDTVLAAAALFPPQKVWTAFVGLGSGWDRKRDEIIGAVHHYFHELSPKRIQFDDRDSFWDCPDMLIFPGFMLKKHDCCSEPGLIDHWPVYAEIPSALNDPVRRLRPLALARGFFNHFVRSSLRGKLDTGEAWSDAESSSIFGPNRRQGSNEQRLVTVTHAPANLFIRDPRPEGHTVFLHFVRSQNKCSMGRAYIYERKRNSRLDGKGISV